MRVKTTIDGEMQKEVVMLNSTESTQVTSKAKVLCSPTQTKESRTGQTGLSPRQPPHGCVSHSGHASGCFVSETGY